MLFNTLTNRREIVKTAAVLAAGVGAAGTSIATAQTPAATPALENTGHYSSAEGEVEITWDTASWDIWDADDNSVVIGSDGDGSTPYAYRYRSVVSERQWESGEAGLESAEENALAGEGVVVIATHADESTMGYIRRSESPGGEAYSIFEFFRVSEDEDKWVSSECWIHVDQFDIESTTSQLSGLTLNGNSVPSVWTIEEATQLITDSAE